MKTLFFLSIFCITCILLAFSQCLDDKKSLLLGLRNSLRFSHSDSTKLVHWNHTNDCCNWDGVECDVFGHVISLQLDNETISGGIENSEYLFNLSYLKKLNLSYNSFNGIQIPEGISNLANLTHLNLSCAVPDFLADFSKLTTLSLAFCSLLGSFPERIFEIPSLQRLDLLDNPLLSGSFPMFLQKGSLRTIVLEHTNFSGPLPDSIGNLTMLSTLELSNCRFFGQLPPTVANLTELTDLDISDNNFTGSIPSSLFALPSLISLLLSDNEFHGQVRELSNLSSSILQILDVSSNNLEGPVPKFFFELEQLKSLSLSSNKFNGAVQMEMFKNPRFDYLDLSHNDLFVQSTDSDSSLPPLLNIGELRLASCKLQRFPNLPRQSRLSHLDLSSNQLKGEIPNWIWEIGNGSLRYLNLSNNLLHGFQKPYKFPSSMWVLDLHSNQILGELPNDIGLFLSMLLDLSANALTGGIPPCLPSNNSLLGVLNLGRNNLSGAIPQTPKPSR
ncbi:Leucine-rich repeat (LRR) protein associated with apoptosis in muscle tissue [Handroanthus impetiginosus]|uniref:Leucine-rich repeat (LRR) protein associated with apoptosis in muscle tissue n=1 Tax=Handroanthus impetiginosus TaxID=429701 RepID=A0A2G9HQQ9_9LAMI|nr:Leucine-rich repeat (LRR) protein associated with apoptosis in muscle tissue [Handroanthus impetiginosus]